MLFQINQTSNLTMSLLTTDQHQESYKDLPTGTGCPHSLYILQECKAGHQALGAPKINAELGRILYNPHKRNLKYIR